jgi:predicted deacylase
VYSVDHVFVTDNEAGIPVTIAVHRLSGQRPGPTVALVGTQHGDEWFCVSLFESMIDTLRGQEIRGRVVLVPVANPTALAAVHRVSQVDADVPDLNRAWPGSDTWLAGQVAARLTAEVLETCDAVLDIHTGSWGVAWCAAQYGDDIPDETVRQRSRSLAFGFGLDCVQRGRVLTRFPGPTSLTGYSAAGRGIPAASIWLGGAGFSPALESTFRRDAARGLVNTLRCMGMVDGKPDLPSTVLHFLDDIRMNPRRGGFLRPQVDEDRLLRDVGRGEQLAVVLNPQTLEVVERVTAPCDGALLYVSRSRLVTPGGWAFGLAAADGAEHADPRRIASW